MTRLIMKAVRSTSSLRADHLAIGVGHPRIFPVSSLRIAKFEIRNRLFVGTGKYASYEVMQKGAGRQRCQVVTVAVRRERLVDKEGPQHSRFPRSEQIYHSAQHGRVFQRGGRHPRRRCWAANCSKNRRTPAPIGSSSKCWAIRKRCCPIPMGTLEATRELVKEGFTVLCYTSDDPIAARRIKEAGAASVMPAGSPIGSRPGRAESAQHFRSAWKRSRKAIRIIRSSSMPASAPPAMWRLRWNLARTACCSTPASPMPKIRENGRRHASGAGSRPARLRSGPNPQETLRHRQQPVRRRHQLHSRRMKRGKAPCPPFLQ